MGGVARRRAVRRRWERMDGMEGITVEEGVCSRGGIRNMRGIR
jgi:hypothetical protein